MITSLFSRGSVGRFFLRQSCRLLAAAALGATQPLLAQAPLNDVFPGTLLYGSTNLLTASNVNATGEAGEPAHAGNAASASIWWTWIAPESGLVTIDTAGSALDTVLAAYTGSAVNALSLIAASDDADGLATSAISFPVIGGNTYHFAVDGYAGSAGDIQLRLQLPVAASAPSFTSHPVDQTAPDNAGNNVTFSAGVTGSFPLSLVWQKGDVNLAGGTNATYTLTNVIAADAGNYRLIVTNPYGSATSFVATLTVLSPHEQDMFAGRASLTGQVSTVTAHNYGATTEPGEPLHAGVTNGASLWWTWTAPKNGLTVLDTAGSVDAFGTELDTVLAIYTGTNISGLTPVATNDDEVFEVVKTSKAVFRAAAGTRYQIAVAGVQSPAGTPAAGNITLHLSQSRNNDYFTNALEFSPDVGTVEDDNTGATAEAGEPAHAGNPGAKSVWWYWVAPTNGTYELDTEGSAFDTVLAVYTGTNVNHLFRIAEDDNRSEGGSLVKFFAVGGTMYHFVVDGYTSTNGTETGAIRLNLNASLALNDNFADRVSLSGQTNRITASNIGATKEPGEPDHAGNAGGRSVWWIWTAPLSEPVFITTLNSSFDTTLAVYTGSQLSSLTLLAENDDPDPNGALSGSAVLFQAVAGQTYQIAVDGFRFSDSSVAEGTLTLGIYQPNRPVAGGNDLFANRFLVTGQTNTVMGLNTNATKEMGEPDHAGNDGGRSVWWAWIAPASGPVRIDTIGSSFETVLGIYEGTDVSALTLVAEDERSGGNGWSIATFNAVAGVEYQIAVDGFNNGAAIDAGGVVLNLRQYSAGDLHANDNFEQAAPIFDPFLSVVGLNLGATRQNGEPQHGGLQQGHSVWWTWTANANGPVTIATTNSQFDTILAAYTGTEVGALSLVAENDDLDAFHLQSSVTFEAIEGMPYHIAVDGYAGQIGQVNLTVSPGTEFPSAPQIQQAPTDQVRFAGGAGGGATVPFKVVTTGSAPMFFQWLRDGVVLPGATNDLLMLTNASANDAGAYQVVISNEVGVATSPVARFIQVSSSFNDDFANRILISGVSNIVSGSILGATKQPGEPHHGGETGGRSVWWRWVAVSDGPVQVHTFGSSFDTLLAVYEGEAVGNLTLIAENDDLLHERVATSGVLFQAVAGKEYQIAVDCPKTNGADGRVALTVQPSPSLIALPLPVSTAVHVTNTAFALQVMTSGAPSLHYQWLFNGTPIRGATNQSYALGALSRARSGLYTVVVTDGLGNFNYSQEEVRVQVPQRLQTLQRLSDGRVRVFFSDPDGSLAADPARFEVSYTTDLDGPQILWVPTPGAISVDNGRFVFEDQTSAGASQRFYRVLEK